MTSRSHFIKTAAKGTGLAAVVPGAITSGAYTEPPKKISGSVSLVLKILKF